MKKKNKCTKYGQKHTDKQSHHIPMHAIVHMRIQLYNNVQLFSTIQNNFPQNVDQKMRF